MHVKSPSTKLHKKPFGISWVLADGYDEVNSSSAVDCCCEHFKKCSFTISELDHMGHP